MIHQTLKLQYRPALQAILLLELFKLFFEGFITYVTHFNYVNLMTNKIFVNRHHYYI